MALSATHAAALAACSTAARSISATSVSSRRTSMARAPWPTPHRKPQSSAPVALASAAGAYDAGASASATRSHHPKRFTPAAASTMASYRGAVPSPAVLSNASGVSSFARRVCRLPRTSAVRRSGRIRCSSACRLSELVPISDPAGKDASDVQPAAAWLGATKRTSRGSSRCTCDNRSVSPHQHDERL
jgi:hypothetical protein